MTDTEQAESGSACLERKPGPQSTLSGVREQLVEAASTLLNERGIDLALSSVPLSEVIAAAGVSRSTAYRSLADEVIAPQEVLHRALLSQLLTRVARDENHAQAVEAVSDELGRQQESFESEDVRLRTQAMRALIRVGINASYYNIAGSVGRSVLTASYGSLRSLRSSAPSDWRHGALIQGEQELAQLFADLYLGLSTLFQYRLRPEFSIYQFSTAVASLLEGTAMRHGVSDYVDGIERPTGPGEELEAWTLCATAFEGMYIVFFEPEDPDDPFADLVHY